MYWYRFGSGAPVPVQVQRCSGTGPEICPECGFFFPFSIYCYPNQLNTLYTLQNHSNFILKSQFYSIHLSLHIFLQNFSMNFSQNHSNMGHNPYTNQIQGFVRVCSNPNSFTLQLTHESNLKGRIPYSSCTL